MLDWTWLGYAVPGLGTVAALASALLIDADWVSTEKRRAAKDFRDGEGKPGARHTVENGTPANPDYTRVRTPPAAVVESVRLLWPRIRRRANIMLVVDVSGSMRAPVESAGRSRLAPTTRRTPSRSTRSSSTCCRTSDGPPGSA